MAFRPFVPATVTLELFPKTKAVVCSAGPKRQEARSQESEIERRRFRDAVDTRVKDRIDRVEEHDWRGDAAISEEPFLIAVVAVGVGGTNNEGIAAD